MTKKSTEIPGIDPESLPDLVQGARLVSASPLDQFIEEVLQVTPRVDTDPGE